MITKLLASTALSVIAVTSFAANNETNQTAVVDMQALASSKTCTAMIDVLKSEYEPQLQEIRKEANALDPKSKNKTKEEMLTKQFQEIQKEAQDKAQTAQINCINTIRAAAKIVAEKDGYSIVLPKMGALYVNSSSDITPLVLKQLNSTKTESK
jgi:Skp family chaperone for outer membrane proteins